MGVSSSSHPRSVLTAFGFLGPSPTVQVLAFSKPPGMAGLVFGIFREKLVPGSGGAWVLGVPYLIPSVVWNQGVTQGGWGEGTLHFLQEAPGRALKTRCRSPFSLSEPQLPHSAALRLTPSTLGFKYSHGGSPSSGDSEAVHPQNLSVQKAPPLSLGVP